MTSTWGPDGGAWSSGAASGGGSWPPGLGQPLAYDLAPEPTSGRRGWRAGATALAGILVIGTLGFAAINLTAADGADSPEAAVEGLFEAIDQEDLIGMVESLEPAERRLLLSTVQELQAEGERLGLADPDTDLRGLQGLDLEVSDLQLQTEELADGVVAVEVGGSISGTTDLRELPLGPVIDDAIGRAREDGDEEWDDTATDRTEIDGRLVAVRRGGGWHVSLVASLAEAIRRDSDDPAPFPNPDDAIPAVGADSPEAAVQAMIDAATALDGRRMIELTDPEEAEVLHRYGPLLVDGAEEAAATDSSVEVSDLSLVVDDGPDGDKVVRADSITVTIGDDESTFTTSYADGCTEVTYDYSDEYRQGYLDEWGEDEDASWLDGDTYRTCAGDPLGPESILASFQAPGLLSVVVTEHDGQWYVRPGATFVETLLDSLRALDRDTLERSVRIWAGEYWLSAPDSFWEACGVDRPGHDASRQDAEDAYESCYEQLPDDYDFSDWPFGSFFGPVMGSDEFETIGEPIDAGPEEACYSDDAYEQDDPDAAIVACLQDLADAGEIDQRVVEEFRCNLVYQDIPWDEDLTDEEWDALYEQADEAYAACIDGVGADEPTPPATAVPSPTTTAPPAPTTTVTSPPTTAAPTTSSTTTTPPVTTTTGG